MDLGAALVFLVVALLAPGARPGLLILVPLGSVAFGILEYAVHRWVLHGPVSIATRGHAHHHARPSALIATPPFVAVAISIVVWGVFRLVMAPAPSALLVFGLYAGYNYFALFHHWEHHHRRNATCGAYWKRLDRAHRLHHQRQNVNFGVSTTIWDRLFGTSQPVD